MLVCCGSTLVTIARIAVGLVNTTVYYPDREWSLFTLLRKVPGSAHAPPFGHTSPAAPGAHRLAGLFAGAPFETSREGRAVRVRVC